jgi:hypothetical protein
LIFFESVAITAPVFLNHRLRDRVTAASDMCMAASVILFYVTGNSKVQSVVTSSGEIFIPNVMNFGLLIRYLFGRDGYEDSLW